jgi:hypothetical protein
MYLPAPGGCEAVAYDVRNDGVETAVHPGAFDYEAALRQRIAHGGSVEP